MDRPAVRDAALLIFRAVLGLVFVAHGVDRIFFTGISATAAQFAQWSIPQPGISAWLAAVLEMVGGSLLVIGLLTTAVAGVLALLAAAAGYFVHFDNGIFYGHGGFEYPLVLTVSLLMIVVFGAGRASLDEVLSRVES
ncbi:membrane protein [Corynebacterium phocae]|uniref:Membrane protein n=1 Tax=Corynebacterium phocae TaxID=161895 RepID=A0A1L7D6I7_9CORY|nr:DoxX family protein [Corynebacterium phocae]APT93758.1 membrane protein [Corynebacterium phocae]KAA8723295.1 DoxX family protein [Corynebacterium phocae]